MSGTISEEAFAETVNRYEAERQQKNNRLVVLEQTEQETAAKLTDIHRWMRLISENSVNDDVSRELLEALIERIEVGEKKIENGVKTQNISIIFKFVGNV